jgi:hypothetical protein
MKRYLCLTLRALFGLAFFTSLLQSQTVTILESFEDGIDLVTLTGDRAEFSSHTKTGADDLGVTDGEKALKITLTDNYGFGADGDIVLSEEASNLVKQAWASRAEARYIIRVDVLFPESGHNWGNIQFRVNGWDYAQLESNSGALSMSLPLDLISNDLVAEEVITLQIIDQYGVGDDPGSLEIFIDNIRLIDLYVPGAIPEVTVINGFETEDEVKSLVTISERYTNSLHKKTGPDDLSVTEGEGSLELAFTTNGSWTQDFTIPLKGSILESISRLPMAARQRYVLRMDVIFEDQSEGNWGNGNWQNLVIRTTGGGAQPFAMHRFGADQHVRTFSAVLDEFVLNASDPDNPEDLNPGFNVVNQGAWSEPGMTYHFDNIRVIDTGKAPLAIGNLEINADNKSTVSWNSSDSQTYAIDASNDLTNWSELVTGVLGEQGAESTTYVDAAGNLDGQKFYRVRVAGAAPPLNEGFENGLNGWTATMRPTNSGSTEWEVGAPSIGAKAGAASAGTALNANYTDGTHIALQSPEADLLSFVSPPTITFSYYLDADDDSAGRVNILDTSGNILEEGNDDNGLIFTGSSDSWQEVAVELPTFGQKVIIEFEFVDAGSNSTNGAGFFIDDVFIDSAE